MVQNLLAYLLKQTEMFAKPQTRAPRYMPIKSFFLAIGWLSAISITTTTEVLKLLGKLSPNKATGLDNISCRLLKEAGPIIATSLTCIINKTIDTGLFPSQWKMAKVFPLYKKDDHTKPAISKICERVVYDQLYGYLNSNGLLTKNQSGFRSLYSTVTALLHLANKPMSFEPLDRFFKNLKVLRLTFLLYDLLVSRLLLYCKAVK